MPALEIFGFANSTYVRAVRLACEEKRLPYSYEPVPPGHKPVSDIHPYGKVPVMRHGKIELFESKAIVTYIDRKFPGRSLMPDDALKAAQAEKWIAFTNVHVYPTLIGKYVLQYLHPPAGEIDRARIEAVLPDLRKQIAIFDSALAKTGYLAGRGLTYADLNLVPIINYVGRFQEGKDALADADHLAAWFVRLTARRSWKVTDPAPS